MEKKEETKVTINFYVRGITFETAEEMIRGYKTCPDVDYDELFGKYLSLETDEGIYNEAVEKCKNLWDVCPPFTPSEVLKTYSDNAEKRMLLLSFFEPEEVVNDLESELIDIQTINKIQKKTTIEGFDNHSKIELKDVRPENIGTIEHVYDDTYELHKVSKEILGTDDDVYYVKCKDASHEKYYYLFVEENTDAISAIASTMRKENGEPISKEEYLAIVSET